MDKLKMESENLTERNIEKIAELFPNVITETKDENGKIRKGINFGLLQQELSEDLVEGDESYEFTWVGKKQSIIEGNKPIRKTLRPCIEESKNWENTENLYIEGDISAPPSNDTTWQDKMIPGFVFFFIDSTFRRDTIG